MVIHGLPAGDLPGTPACFWLAIEQSEQPNQIDLSVRSADREVSGPCELPLVGLASLRDGIVHDVSNGVVRISRRDDDYIIGFRTIGTESPSCEIGVNRAEFDGAISKFEAEVDRFCHEPTSALKPEEIRYA